MPTRFYLPSTGAADVSPALDAGWEAQTPVQGAALDYLKCVTARINSAMATKSRFANNTGQPFDTPIRVYVSEPLTAQTITGTVKGQILAKEPFSTNNSCAQIAIKVVSGSGGTVRGTLLPMDTDALSNEFATTLTNRRFPRDGAVAVASVVALAGDRIVIELGFRSHLNSANAHDLRFGDVAAADLAEDETTTTDNNPWIEFSQALVFEAGGISNPICVLTASVGSISHVLPAAFWGMGQAPITAAESTNRADWKTLVRALGMEIFRLSAGYLNWNTVGAIENNWGVLQGIMDDLVTNGVIVPKAYISAYTNPVGAPIVGADPNAASYPPATTGAGSVARLNEFVRNWHARWGSTSIDYIEPDNEPAIHRGKTAAGGGVGYTFSSAGTDREAADYAAIWQRNHYNAAKADSQVAPITYGGFVYASATAVKSQFEGELARYLDGAPIGVWPWGADDNSGYFDSLTWHNYGGTTLGGGNFFPSNQDLLNAVFAGVNADGTLAFHDPRVRTFYGAAAAYIRQELDNRGMTAASQRMGEFGPYYFNAAPFGAQLEGAMMIASYRWQAAWKLDGIVFMGLRRTPVTTFDSGDRVIFETGGTYVGGPRYYQFKEMGGYFCRKYKKILTQSFTNTGTTPTNAASGGNSIGSGQPVVGLSDDETEVGVLVLNANLSQPLDFEYPLGFAPSADVDEKILTPTIGIDEAPATGTFTVSGTTLTRTLNAGELRLFEIPRTVTPAAAPVGGPSLLLLGVE